MSSTKSRSKKQSSSAKNRGKNQSALVSSKELIKLNKTRLRELNIKKVKASQELYVTQELYNKLSSRNADRLLTAKKYKSDILSKRQRDQLHASETYGEHVTLDRRGRIRRQYRSTEDGSLPTLAKIKRYEAAREKRKTTGWLPEEEWSDAAEWAKAHDADAVNFWFKEYTRTTVAAE